MTDEGPTWVLLPPGQNPTIGPERRVRRRGPVSRYDSSHGSVRYLYELDGQTVAGLQLVTGPSQGSAVVANVYVLPDRRRRGLAAQLLEHARKDFPGVTHSQHLSEDGKAWTKAMFGALRSRLRALDKPAFWRWFGASKVVDADGEPLVVWHGTQDVFDAFTARTKSINTTTFGPVETERSGIFVSDNVDFARQYGDHTLALYAAIENPAELDRDVVLDFAESIDPWAERDLYLLAMHTPSSWQLFDGELGRRFVAFLQARGYDGATFTEELDTDQGPIAGRTFVAFAPTQIKSATDNVGTFNPTEPSMFGALASRRQRKLGALDPMEQSIVKGQMAKYLIRYIDALAEAADALHRGADEVRELGALDLAATLDEKGDVLAEEAHHVYAEASEERVEHHEGLDVELQFAQAWSEYQRGASHWQRPADLAQYLRSALFDAGYRQADVQQITDEQLLAEARAAHTRREQHRQSRR